MNMDSLKKCTMGDLGEQIVAALTNSKRGDWYDDTKDMKGIIDQLTREIKAQRRNIIRNELTIAENQLPKCLGVDELWFVEWDATSKLKLWKVTNRDNYSKYTTKTGKKMVGWKDKDMELVGTIDDKSLAQKFQNNTTTNYKNLVFKK